MLRSDLTKIVAAQTLYEYLWKFHKTRQRLQLLDIIVRIKRDFRKVPTVEVAIKFYKIELLKTIIFLQGDNNEI